MIRSRQKLGKYRIERRLGVGGFAAVYDATDTIEGLRVALKVPYAHYIDTATMEDLRKEVRMVAQLRHPNVLPLKTADLIDGRLVLVFPLGEKSLAQRLQRRLSVKLALSFTEQILEAVAYAHERKIIHCDIKPENLILFSGTQVVLADFGIARVAQRTVQGSGSGTVGYIAPEQAMGKPSFRSDVFSIGLIAYRMFSGHLPEWPFHWPPAGFARVRDRLHPNVVEILRRSLELDPRKRFRDAGQMLSAFRRVKNRAVRKGASAPLVRRKQTGRDWRTMRFSQFRKQYGKELNTVYKCHHCHGPVSEPMRWCPWCGDSRETFHDETRFPQCCPRCNRGMKLDWQYCPWCYGAGFELSSPQKFSDIRYVARCANSNCKRKDLMPFMHYCPWCRRKVRRKWKLPDTADSCHACDWGVAKDFWNYCPWCGEAI